MTYVNKKWTVSTWGLFNASRVRNSGCSVGASVDQTPVGTIGIIINILPTKIISIQVAHGILYNYYYLIKL